MLQLLSGMAWTVAYIAAAKTVVQWGPDFDCPKPGVVAKALVGCFTIVAVCALGSFREAGITA